MAKISIAMLHWRIERSGNALSLRLKVSFGIVAVWGIAAIFLVAFQCPPPSPWSHLSTGCSIYGPVQYTVIALDMASDIWLAIAPLSMITRLSMPRGARRRIMLLLALRLLVPGLSIGQAIAVSKTVKSADKTWERSLQVMWEIFVIFCSVFCSVVPRTQRFWLGLQSGGAIVEARDEYELSSGGSNLHSHSRRPPNGTDGQPKSNTSQQGRNHLLRNVGAMPSRRTSQDSETAFFGFSKDIGYSKAFARRELPGREPMDGIMQTREVTVE
jgi:hypothetical protein